MTSANFTNWILRLTAWRSQWVLLGKNAFNIHLMHSTPWASVFVLPSFFFVAAVRCCCWPTTVSSRCCNWKLVAIRLQLMFQMSLWVYACGCVNVKWVFVYLREFSTVLFTNHWYASPASCHMLSCPLASAYCMQFKCTRDVYTILT